VNGVSEQDLELLEEYLDGALAPDEIGRLCARLAAEPALSAELDELRAARATRAAVWTSLEPSEADAMRFAARVAGAARRQDRWSRVGVYARFGSAAAACLLVGFFLGWLGRDRGPTAPALNMPAAHVNDFVEGPAPSLGVTIREVRYEVPGHRPQPMLVVSEVPPGSAAAGAGLQEGDLLLSIDGQPVRDYQSLKTALDAHTGTRAMRILRDNQILEASIEIR
jgi:hypothetical protein